MGYDISIKTAMIVFPIISFLFTIPFMLSQYHKYGSVHWFRVIIIYSFILYLISAYFMVILPLPSIDEVLKNTGPFTNLIPFSFVADFIKETSFVLSDPTTYLTALKQPCFYVVLFNVLLTIPFGMYLRYYYKCSLKKTLFFTFLLSLFFELTQLSGLYFIYPKPYRLFDVDDLLLNTLGGFVGYVIVGLFKRVLPSRDKIDEEAIKKGKKVSGIRRITLFFLDLFLTMIILLFASVFIKSNYLFYITFFIYYVIVPTLWNGKTFGSAFLNVRFVYQKNYFLNHFIRLVFIYLFYYKIPLWIIVECLQLNGTLSINEFFTFVFIAILLFVLFIIHMVNMFKLMGSGKTIYDGILKVKCESTIMLTKTTDAGEIED